MRRENNESLGSQIPDLGTLSERVTIQTATATRDVNGAEVLTYANTATVWARVESANTGNSEQLTADQTTVFTRYKITIRYRTDIGEKTRISYNDGIQDMGLDILFKEVLGQRRFLKLVCEHRK